MFSDTYETSANIMTDLFRSFFALIDRIFYGLLGWIYELFFNVASTDLFTNDTIMRFYSRVQLILGVFMMFQLAMIIIKGIVNPDSFTDSKSGAGNLIMRICVALFLLTALVPINIPSPQNEYETQINNNGLLFGTLYSLQYRILENNTLGRLIMGTDAVSNNYVSSNTSSNQSLRTASRIFTSTIFKTFYRINLENEDNLDAAAKEKCSKATEPAVYNECRMCQSGIDAYIDAYKEVDADPSNLLDMVKETCSYNSNAGYYLPFKYLTGNERYIFAYSPIISTITAIAFIVIMLSFTIDIGVRMVKLAILRLIAPIPIITYMDPKGTKDSAFNAWVKTLTSTYLDLFVRLAVVYFVLFLIQQIIIEGISIPETTGPVRLFTRIVVFISLFIFAKQAPKFFRQVLGLKDTDFKLLSGLGVMTAGLGAIGSTVAGYRSSLMADQTRESFGVTDRHGNVVDPTSIPNRAKHIVAGIAGGLSGAFRGAGAALDAKDHNVKASLDAMKKYNSSILARGNDGSTLFGRWGSTASNVFTGEGRAAATERDIASLESKRKALDAIKSRVSGEMVKQDWTYGTGGGLGKGHLDTSGRDIGDVRFNNKEFVNAIKKAEADGSGIAQVVDMNGNTHSIDVKIAGKMSGNILKENEDSYISEVTAGNRTDVELMSLIKDAEMKGAASDTRQDGSARTISGYSRRVSGHITSRDDYTKVSEAMGQEVRDMNRDNTINKANDSHSNQKK